jgi:hypothetical protein
MYSPQHLCTPINILITIDSAVTKFMRFFSPMFKVPKVTAEPGNSGKHSLG